MKTTTSDKIDRKRVDLRPRRIDMFMAVFKKIAHKFDWELVTDSYMSNGKLVTTKAIRSFKGNKEYCPFTAYVEEMTGSYFTPSRFDLAAGAAFVHSDTVRVIVDAIDDWPDKGHGYAPKGLDLSVRKRLLDHINLG